MIMVSDEKPNKKELYESADVLTAAFRDDPLYNAIFQNEKELRIYLKMMIDYYKKNGEIHLAMEGQKIIGVSLWNPGGGSFFSIGNVLASHMFGDIFRFFLMIRLKSILKLKNEVLITERYHFKREHHYLFMIGSVQKGAGRCLMEYAMEKFDNYPIYLENSNIKDNQKFYGKLGFEAFKTIEVMGVPVDLMTNSKGDQGNEKFDG